MKELKVAQSAGFCFGVSRSVKMAEQMLSEERSCFSFGELIHNADVVRHLEQKGLRVTNDLSALGEGDAVIIRSHGITKALCEQLAATGAKLVDATTPPSGIVSLSSSALRITLRCRQSAAGVKPPSSPETPRSWNRS